LNLLQVVETTADFQWAGNGGVDDEATKIIAEREEKIYRFR